MGQYDIEDKFHAQVGDVKIRSSKQLRELLYKKMKLPVVKKTKKFAASTDEEALTELYNTTKNEILAMILSHRKGDKLLGTYVKGILNRLDSKGIIHTSFLIHGTLTGRLASKDPNFQNMPKETKDPRIKRMFIARPGCVFLEADYGQAEFRHWGNYSQDPRIIADIVAASNGTGPDIHKLMASLAFNISVEKVTKDQRQDAKSIVFGFMYGRSIKSVAEQIGCSEVFAQKVASIFFARYPKAKAWLRNAVSTVKRYHQIRSLFGRLHRIAGINSAQKVVRSEAERRCMNFPIQAAASDMNCNSANRIMREFKKQGLKGQLCILVHDSFLCEVPENEVEKSIVIIKGEMERPVLNMNVPMNADIKIGTRWGDLKEVKSDEIKIQEVASKS